MGVSPGAILIFTAFFSVQRLEASTLALHLRCGLKSALFEMLLSFRRPYQNHQLPVTA
jgi:hypothetical protein